MEREESYRAAELRTSRQLVFFCYYIRVYMFDGCTEFVQKLDWPTLRKKISEVRKGVNIENWKNRQIFYSL